MRVADASAAAATASMLQPHRERNSRRGVSRFANACKPVTVRWWLALLCGFAALWALVESGLSLISYPVANQCIEYPDDSTYEEVAIGQGLQPAAEQGYLPEEHHFSSSASLPFRLLRIVPQHAEQLATSLSSTSTLPILFVHGHRGSVNEGNLLSTLLAHRDNAALAAGQPIRAPAYSVYGIDFAGASTAFHVGLVENQATFLIRSIRTLLARHPAATSVLVVAHSMGGLVTRTAFQLAPSFMASAVPTVLTLSSPHQAHPYVADARMEALYAAQQQQWSGTVEPEGSRRARRLEGNSVSMSWNASEGLGPAADEETRTAAAAAAQTGIEASSHQARRTAASDAPAAMKQVLWVSLTGGPMVS